MELDKARSMLDDIDHRGQQLTDWEIDFVDDLLRSTDKGIQPTDEQGQIIRRIYDQRVP